MSFRVNDISSNWAVTNFLSSVSTSEFKKKVKDRIARKREKILNSVNGNPESDQCSQDFDPIPAQFCKLIELSKSRTIMVHVRLIKVFWIFIL